MNRPTSPPALNQYRSVETYGGVEDADPHKLVQMLYDGLAAALVSARGAMERNEIAAKGAAVIKAVDILEALRTSLDAGRGGDVAANLGRLYEYMEHRLTEANLYNDIAAIAEVCTLNDTLRGAWQAIPQDLRQGTLAA